MTATRVIAYAPNGASQGPVPTPQDLQVGFPLNDVGALALNYPPDAPRSELLGQPVELAVEVSWDKGLTWTEPASSRFLYLRDGRDPIKTGDAFAIEAAGYILRLQKALVGLTSLNAEGNREFIGKAPGDILLTLWNEAQARGALTGMTATWTAAADSAGTAWPSTIPQVAYEPGKNLLSVLTELAEQGYVDFRTQGRSVQVYVADTAAGMAADRTTGANPVSLRFGRDLTEAPFRRTWEGLADTAIVRGDNNSSLERTNAGAITPWGRQETYVTASGVDDAGTLQVIADAALELTAQERAEHTFGLDFSAATHLPFRDYAPGEWVYAAVDGAGVTRMRVRQVTLTRDDSGAVGGNVVLNDRFLEADVLTARRLQQLTQGATQGGTGTTPGSTPGQGNDILAPAQVLGMATSSAAYVEADGRVQAQITVDWADVTTNADGTPTTDVDHYEVQSRVTGTTEWRDMGTRETSTWSNSPYDPGDSWDFRVRAVDTVFNRGAWSAIATQVAAADAVGPLKPATPTVTSRLGVARVAWNGLRDTGAAMDPDFAYVAVHVSTVNNFAPTDATKVGELLGAGYAVAGPLDYSTTYYAKFVPYDTSGNAGTISAQAAFTVAPLVDVSNFPDSAMQDLYARTGKFLDLSADNFSANLIEGMWIKAGAISAEKLTVGALGQDLILNGSFEETGYWTLANGGTRVAAAARSGVMGLRCAASGGSQASSPIFPLSEGTVVVVSAWAVTRAAPSALYLRVQFLDSAGAEIGISDPVGNTNVPTSWTKYEAQAAVAPAGTVNARFQVFNTTGAVDVDDVSVRKATTNGQITEVAAGKIKTGVLQATERIVAGSLTGARAELNGVGFQAFNAAGAKTFEVKGSDGTVFSVGSFNTNFTSYTGARVFMGEDAAFGGGLIQFFNNTYSSAKISSWGSSAANGGLRLAGQQQVILAVDGDTTNTLALWLSTSTTDTRDVNIRANGRGTEVSGGTLFTEAINASGNIATNGNTITGGPTISGGPTCSGGFTTAGTNVLGNLADGAADNASLGAKYVRCTANGTLKSSTTAPSSRRLKHDIQRLATVDEDQFMRLESYLYRYNEAPDTVRLGLLAEDTHKAGWDLLVGYEDYDDPTRPTGIDYDAIGPLLIPVVQDLIRRVRTLEGITR